MRAVSYPMLTKVSNFISCQYSHVTIYKEYTFNASPISDLCPKQWPSHTAMIFMRRRRNISWNIVVRLITRKESKDQTVVASKFWKVGYEGSAN